MTRPTTDRIRESIFNKLIHAPWGVRLDGLRVIDLFAGSGALGLEAISRGAAFALFVDTDAAAHDAIRSNVDTLQLSNYTRLYRRSAISLGPKSEKIGAPFDLVFLDPPYGKALGDRVFSKLIEDAWVKNNAVAVLEEHKSVEVTAEGWELLDTLEVGDTAVHFFKRVD